MAELTKKDYISETMRLCKNLTQLKYDEEYDQCLKKMVSYNLEMLRFFPSRKTMSNKQILLNSFLIDAFNLTRTKFNTAEDLNAKKLVQARIVVLQEFEKQQKAEKENKKWKEQVAKIVSACSTKRG